MKVTFPPSVLQLGLRGLIEEFEAGQKKATLSGLWGASKAFILADLYRLLQRPFLVLSPSEQEAEALRGDLGFFLGREVGFLPEPEEEIDVHCQRIACLKGLLFRELSIVVASVQAAMEPTISPETLAASVLSLYPQRIIAMETVLQALVEGGYRSVPQVTERGEYSRRGGILDMFPPMAENPIRLEFFGDEIVSLREFDPETQRSIRPLEKVTLLPVSETAFVEQTSLLQYLPEEALLALDEPVELSVNAKANSLAWEDFLEASTLKRVHLERFARPKPVAGVSLSFETRSVPAYRGRITELVRDLMALRKEGWLVQVVCRGEAQGKRLQEILKEHELAAAFGPPSARGGIGILTGQLSSGFAFPALGLSYLTEAEIFGPRPILKPKPRPKEAFPSAVFEVLKEGDFVVHEEHGIGRYQGLQKLEAGGLEGDYLLLEYAEGNKLYVPVEKLHLVHRYIGGDEMPPALNRLGTTTWARAKERVKAHVREMAKDLLELYAARAVVKGFAFSTETPWQKEFEAAFPYEETPGQLQAIDEVKRDMEKDRPMDRLVCGDVGYGKTEVALRAAFKAVMDGKQVAVLVPTTVLALQHHQTFSERFAPFPVVVEMLSRFRSPGEQREVLRGLREGTVDIVIGTHRLLQKDVRFRDLGLLVVDEEHRFGVAAKERLKQLRKEVDVLTLTATPIPRTLQMALFGVRDISTIETPPPERLSVKTHVARYDPRLIQEAIEQELTRGGQVFFVHNRVEDIQAVAETLRRLVPSARLAVAHGELPEETLERIMCDFYAGQYDVLLSTTIIESGLDIPTANTIIINRADRLGLAQLYQLRGRVGRERRKAYAYLLIPEAEPLSELAKQRLQVIAELTELGSGFKVAERDLEIRGAGNLLGPEQHGHISAVGFDLYLKLVEAAVKELKGEMVEQKVEPTLKLPLQGYLPEAYVSDPGLRLFLYKRLASFEDSDALSRFEEELRDRFGDPPEPVRWLLEAVWLKITAKALGIREVDGRKEQISITFADNPPVKPEKVVALLQAEGGRLTYLPEGALEYTVEGGPAERLRAVKYLLQSLA